jgi:hypothetical protein
MKKGAVGMWTMPRLEALVEAVSINGNQFDHIARTQLASDGELAGFSRLQLLVCSKVLFCDIKVPSLTRR